MRQPTILVALRHGNGCYACAKALPPHCRPITVKPPLHLASRDQHCACYSVSFLLFQRKRLRDTTEILGTYISELVSATS